MYQKREDWLTREIQGVGQTVSRLLGGSTPQVEVPLVAVSPGSDPRPDTTAPAASPGRRTARRRRKRARR